MLVACFGGSEWSRAHSSTRTDRPQPTNTVATAQTPETKKIREAFILLRHQPTEPRLRQLLGQAAGRLETIERKREAVLARRRHVTLKQRAKYFNKLARARLRARRRLRFGMGWRATGRQERDAAAGRPVNATWWQRRMRPPGKMERRF